MQRSATKRLFKQANLTDLPSGLFDALPEATAIVDRNGDFSLINKAFQTLLKTHAQSGSCADFVYDDDCAPFSAFLVAGQLSTEERRPTQVRLLAADGTAIWVLASLAPLAIDNPRQALVVQFANISALKAKESELSLKEARWRQALTSSATGVWDHNFATGEMFYSSEWRKMRGLAKNDPIPETDQDWLALIHPDDRDRTMHALERQNAGDPLFACFEYRERHRDGHWVWIECRGACVAWDSMGTPLRIIGIDTDITERKRSEEMLKELSRRLKLALEVSNIGVFEADFDTGRSDWDQSMRKVFGIDENSEVNIGGIWEQLVHPDDRDRVLENVDMNVKNLQPFSDEYRVVLPNGSQRYIRSRTLPYISADGHRRMVGANWDVTADRALRSELERSKTLAEARNGELEKAKAHIEHIAMHDYLTGLPNRRYLDETLAAFGADCEQSGQSLAVLHIDLDRFKQINDTLGHDAGDTMLRHASRILTDNIRDDDFAARIGGDEFVVLVRSDGSQRKLARLADRIISEMRKPVAVDGHECRFGSSIGVAVARGPGLDARQLLLNADIALYHAKNSGRNRCEFFSPDTHSQMISVKKLSDDILRGLEMDEFVPFYQFQFCARTLDVTGVETLARWRHPEKGLLMPDSFLTVADDLDVVATIDGLILEKALVDFKRWRAQGLVVPKLSVNVSSRRLHDPALKKKLSTLDIKPGTVSFELLESTFLDDFNEQVSTNLAHLRKLGIDIEVDDFGTGHASIVSLLRLSPHTFKIDRELISKVPDSKEQRQMVRSIIELGHSLDIRVIAEGVETADHVRVLSELGCDVLQGYGLSKPIPFEETAKFLENESWRVQNHAKGRKGE